MKLKAKHKLIIEDIAQQAQAGKPVDINRSIAKFSKAKPKGIIEAKSRMLKDKDFREALLLELENRHILGANGKIQRRLAEGLDATQPVNKIVGRDEKGRPEYEIQNMSDFRTRLAYIQEINKIAGVYAPEKKEVKKLSINTDMSREELNNKINHLMEQLEQ